MATKAATRIAQEIQQNVSDWYGDSIDHAEFKTRAKALWDQARTQNVEDEVSEIVRPKLN